MVLDYVQDFVIIGASVFQFWVGRVPLSVYESVYKQAKYQLAQLIQLWTDRILFYALQLGMAGTDQRGSYYPSIDEMWQCEINAKQSQQAEVVDSIGSLSNWYRKANQYWSSAEATYDGVLSGFGNLSSIDIKGSLGFLTEYMRENKGFQAGRVLDCGAGIGRIAKELLCSIFRKVDLIDQCQKYIQKAKQILKHQEIGHFYAKGLQDFTPEEKYDCIWIQWVLSHLTDKDAVEFLIKAKSSLTQNGIIVVKENHCDGGFLVDKDDCSVSRNEELYKKLFEQAQLRIVKEKIQENWPKQLLEVRMYLLQ